MMARIDDALETSFAQWQLSGALNPDLSFPELHTLETFEAHDAYHAFYVGLLAYSSKQFSTSATFFLKGLAAGSYSVPMLTEAGELLQQALTSAGHTVQSILNAENGVEILRDRLAAQDELEEMESRVADAALRRLAAPIDAPSCTVEQAAVYCNARIFREKTRSDGDAHFVHAALFWAAAAWAHYHKTYLFASALPKRYDDGPYFPEICDLLTAQRDEKPFKQPPPISESVILKVLNTAIDHVLTFGDERDVCNETNWEPICILTHDRCTMELLVSAYRGRDPTGAIRRIFPCLSNAAASLPSTTISSSSLEYSGRKRPRPEDGHWTAPANCKSEQ
jgi:hypothetical protein